MRLVLHLVVMSSLPMVALATEPPIISIDGQFDDWSEVAPALQDDTGDAKWDIDFTELWLADDDRFVFLRLETTEEFDFSENTDVRIYLDTDADASTGLSIGGIGAELEWKAGERNGTFRHGGEGTTVYHDRIRFRSAPTVTSSGFEMAFGRDTLPDDANPLFPGPEIRILVVDGTTGDRMPDAGETLGYTLDTESVPGPTTLPLEKQNPDNLRFMTHNVLNGGLFNSNDADRFRRLYLAVEPDILNFQELRDYTTYEVHNLIESWLGGQWYTQGVDDCKTASRYPILDTWNVDNNLVTHIDTTASIGSTMLCVNAHLPCCESDESRQRAVDQIVAFIRDAYDPDGDLALGPEVPVMIVGDLNLVGLSQQLNTLLTGDIDDEDTYGPDASPDPDGSDLTNIVSRQTEKRMGYTWRKDSSSFWPGQLDYLIYSDSNLVRRHDFILYTPEMSQDALDAHGLMAEDSEASDHLVFCADFAPPCHADITGDGIVGIDEVLLVLAAWDTSDELADVNGDGLVDTDDLLAVLAAWGFCH